MEKLSTAFTVCLFFTVIVIMIFAFANKSSDSP